MFTSIGKLLFNRAQKSPHDHSVGWIENGKVHFFSFKNYFEHVECLSTGLKLIGLEKKEKIAIISSTCKEWHFLDFACLGLNSIVVPIYPTYTKEEIVHIFNHSESSFLVIENERLLKDIYPSLEKLQHLKAIITFKEISSHLKEQIPSSVSIYSYAELVKKGAENIHSPFNCFTESIETIDPSDIATIVYTSGTTGKPKGAVITHEAFIQMLKNVSDGVDSAFSKSDRSLVFLPLSHVLARSDSYFCVLFGWEMVFAESIERVFSNIQLVKPTMMIAVPRIFEKIYAKILKQVDDENFFKKKTFQWANKVSNNYYEMIQEDKIPRTFDEIQKNLAFNLVFKKIYQMFGGRIRFFVTGGAPLSTDIIKILRNANLTVLEGYGLTETIGPCVLNPLFKQIPGTVGKALGDVKIKLAADGEILIKSKAIFKEYYKNPVETARCFKEEWFKTGDIGIISPDGFLQITDRKKDIIITSGGKNIAPQKIENLLKTKKAISQCVIIGDQRKFLTALICVDKSELIDNIEELGLSHDCTQEELSHSLSVRGIIQKSINEVNQQLAQFETVKAFEILPVQITAQNYLTPSMKIKKKKLISDFSYLVEKMYQ